MKDQLAGRFIVIEGPDASGKETQAGRLTKWLRSSDKSDLGRDEEKKIIEKMPENYPDESASKVEDSVKDGVWRLSFPSYGQTPGGRVVKSYLNGRFGERDDLSVHEKIDIYAADRKQFKLQIAEYLRKGGIIVCDRYREANLIHQLVGCEGDEWEEKLREIKSVDEDLPDPDRVFYLDISPREAARRMEGKDKDIHENDDDYMVRSNQNGRKVAQRENWEMIDAGGSKEEVEERLKESIRDLAEKKD